MPASLKYVYGLSCPLWIAIQLASSNPTSAIEWHVSNIVEIFWYAGLSVPLFVNSFTLTLYVVDSISPVFIVILPTMILSPLLFVFLSRVVSDNFPYVLVFASACLKNVSDIYCFLSSFNLNSLVLNHLNRKLDKLYQTV